MTEQLVWVDADPNRDRAFKNLCVTLVADCELGTYIIEPHAWSITRYDLEGCDGDRIATNVSLAKAKTLAQAHYERSRKS
jgi:hypothetical protein